MYHLHRNEIRPLRVPTYIPTYAINESRKLIIISSQLSATRTRECRMKRVSRVFSDRGLDTTRESGIGIGIGTRVGRRELE